MMAPQKSESPLAGGEIAKQTTEKQDVILAPSVDDSKALATLKAQLAMAGHAVHELASGGYLVVATRWAGMCRECPDLRSLAAFTRQIGARP